jgi:hypothetical protein
MTSNLDRSRYIDIFTNNRKPWDFDQNAVVINKDAQPASSYAKPWYASESIGSDAVHENKQAIADAAKTYGISPDLLSSVVFMENSHGWYDNFYGQLRSSSRPGNLQDRWAGLVPGVSPTSLRENRVDNIFSAAKLLSEIQNHLVAQSIENKTAFPTAAAIATLYNNLQAKKISGYGLTVQEYLDNREWEKHCFPAGTLISLPGGRFRPIEAIAVGDIVLAHDERGALRPARVSRLYENVTHEWIEHVWRDPASGKWRVLTATPGHVMLMPDGGFAELAAMLSPFASSAAALEASQALLAGDLAGEASAAGSASEGSAPGKPNGPSFGRHAGFARIVTETGEAVEAMAFRIAFNEATANLYDRAEMILTRSEGGLAVRPEWKAAA